MTTRFTFACCPTGTAVTAPTELRPAAMLPHLRALPEAEISSRTVGDGMGAGPGWLMRPYFAGSRTTSNSSRFWPQSLGVSKTRTEKATGATLTRLRSSFMENKPSPISALPLQNLAEPSGGLVEPCPPATSFCLFQSSASFQS